MTFLKNFFGTGDKKIVQKTNDVNKYVEDQREAFVKEMQSIARQAKKVRRDTKMAHLQSQELSRIVDDVVNKIAIATGGRRG